MSVPHCIAHLLRVSGEDAAELPKKGAVGEGWVLIATLLGWLLINCINESRSNEARGAASVCTSLTPCSYINISTERNDFLGI